MKKDMYKIISICTAALSVICLIKIASLEGQINNMQSNLSNQIQSVNYSVNNITSNIQNTLNENASIISSSDFTYGRVDLDNKTIELSLRVAPKEYSKDTQAKVILNDREYPLTLANEDFKGTAVIPLFSSYDSPRVVFTDSDAIKTESLDWYINPCESFLPEINAYFSGNVVFEKNTCRKNGTLTADIYYPNQDFVLTNTTVSPIKNVDLITMIGSKEAERININDSVVNEFNPYSPDTPIHINYDMDKSYDISYGVDIELYLYIEDSLGLYHKVYIDSYLSSNDNSSSTVECSNQSRQIFDDKGNLLYEY